MKLLTTYDNYTLLTEHEWMVNASGKVFEHDLIRWCQQFLGKDKVFIDIGAHMGTYSVMLADYAEHVYAFEPQRRTYFQFGATMYLNNKINVTCSNCALSNTTGTKTLHVVSEDGGGSNLDNDNKKDCVLRTESVKVCTLDEKKLPANIGLIKIDVEGHELDVLQGATDTLRRADYPHILFECWKDSWFTDKANALLMYLKKDLGYTVHAVQGTHNMFLASRD